MNATRWPFKKKNNSDKLTKFDASIVKCSVVVNSFFLTAVLKGHSVEREWQIDKVMKWGTIHLMLPMELPFVDGTKAVTEIRGPGFVTCVWLCLGSPCFNKHLDVERGPASPNTALLHKCTVQIAACNIQHMCLQCLWVTVSVRSAPSPSVLQVHLAPSARFGWLVCWPGPRFTALTQESIKGCLGIPGPSPSEISFIIAPSYHGRGAAWPISSATTCVRV